MLKQVITSISVITALMLSLIQPASAEFGFGQSFPDVGADSSYFHAVEYVYGQSIAKGYSDGEFKPALSIERQQFAKMIIEAVYTHEEIMNCDTTVNTYPDVMSDNKFIKHICMVKLKGLASGDQTGNFMPMQNITVNEAEKIIYNALYGPNVEPNVSLALYHQLLSQIQVVPSEIVDINAPLNRGQMALYLYNILNPDAAGITAKVNASVKVFDTGKEFDIEKGQTYRLNNTNMFITFVEVSEDSRCPEGVACIWAGQATATFVITEKGSKGVRFNLTLNPDKPKSDSINIPGYTLKFVDLYPYPKMGDDADKNLIPYVAKMMLEVNDSPCSPCPPDVQCFC